MQRILSTSYIYSPGEALWVGLCFSTSYLFSLFWDFILTWKQYSPVSSFIPARWSRWVRGWAVAENAAFIPEHSVLGRKAISGSFHAPKLSPVPSLQMKEWAPTLSLQGALASLCVWGRLRVPGLKFTMDHKTQPLTCHITRDFTVTNVIRVNSARKETANVQDEGSWLKNRRLTWVVFRIWKLHTQRQQRQCTCRLKTAGLQRLRELQAVGSGSQLRFVLCLLLPPRTEFWLGGLPVLKNPLSYHVLHAVTSKHNGYIISQSSTPRDGLVSSPRVLGWRIWARSRELACECQGRVDLKAHFQHLRVCVGGGYSPVNLNWYTFIIEWKICRSNKQWLLTIRRREVQGHAFHCPGLLSLNRQRRGGWQAQQSPEVQTDLYTRLNQLTFDRCGQKVTKWWVA